MAGAMLFLLISCSVFFAGCTSGTTSTPSVTNAPITPAAADTLTASATTTAVPTTTGTVYTTYTNSRYAFTLQYPSDWQVQDAGNAMGLRDYGKYTYNVVNFYSPKDSSGNYRTFSVDVDPATTTDLERYFNLATLSLGKVYTNMEITKHDYQLKVSDNNAYRLDFKAKDKDPTIEIFTIADNSLPYIVTYDSVDDTEFQAMIKSIQITPVTTTAKSR
jgi:hypothetical protein